MRFTDQPGVDADAARAARGDHPVELEGADRVDHPVELEGADCPPVSGASEKKIKKKKATTKNDTNPKEEEEEEGEPKEFIQEAKAAVKDKAKAYLSEYLSEAMQEDVFSQFTSELKTAREELTSLMGDTAATTHRMSVEDLDKYMKMKKSALKKVEDEAAALAMAGSDAARGFCCKHRFPFEEWLNSDGVAKGACCICPPCAMCPIKCPLQVPCCFPLTVFGVCRKPPLCFALCPKNNPLCTLLGLPCMPVCSMLSKPALVIHCDPPCKCKCCKLSCPTCCKTVGCNCGCCHSTFVCCPVCFACCFRDEAIHKGDKHIYLKEKVPEGQKMDRRGTVSGDL